MRQPVLGAWLFAGVWNLISAAMPFIAYREVVDKGNYAGLLALVFPLVGIGLLVWAIRRTREWRRFGPAPVSLDPFPGSIGGHVGGTIDLAVPFDPAARFDVPEGLDESDAVKKNDRHHLWRLNLSAELPGADLDRDYEIPVYATAAASRRLSDRALSEANAAIAFIARELGLPAGAPEASAASREDALGDDVLTADH